MPVPYEELTGSPTIDISRPDIAGTRRVKINWPLISAFANEVFPNPVLTGYRYGAYLPGFPWAVATGMKVKPFIEEKPRYDVSDWTAWHDFAEVEVTYGVPKWEYKTTNGPSDGDKTITDQPFVTHKLHAGGEFLTYPSKASQWDTPATVMPALVPGVDPGFNVVGASVLAVAVSATATSILIKGTALPQQKNLFVIVEDENMKVTATFINKSGTTLLNVVRGVELSGFVSIAAAHVAKVQVRFVSADAGTSAQTSAGDSTASVMIPLIEHTIDWEYVSQPPWLAIRTLMGKVNATPFAGIPPECGLFLGAEASQQLTITGLKPWKLSYKISEKNQNAGDPNKPQGWNHFMRPNGDAAGTFQRRVKVVPQNANVGAYGNIPGAPIVGLVQAMNSTQTFMKVATTDAPFPQSGQFVVKLDSEVIIVTGIVFAGSPGVWGCIRGALGTTPAAHGTSIGTGSYVTQKAAGIYDLAEFRYLFNLQ